MVLLRVTFLSIPLWCDSNLFPASLRFAARSFQFHHGAILTFDTRQDSRAGDTFQFHYGAILTAEQVAEATDSERFQFHYGAILTQLLILSQPGGILFQFHYGAILTGDISGKLLLHRPFNSTMVRF